METIPLPDKPRSLDEVAERWPTIRQSWLAAFDDCALSSWFEMRYATGGWNTVPSAIGVVFHRVAAACLAEARERDSEVVPVSVALAILEEQLVQKDIPPEDRVRIPLREIKTLRWITAKFARDNRFSVRQIVDIERRIAAPITYVDHDGVQRARILTGKIDTLLADPDDPEGAIIIDFKSGWGIPPRRTQDEPEISYEGLFQLHFYGWLVLHNYPTIKRVKLREFYVRRTEARTETLHRELLDRTEEGLSTTVRDLDYCLASGKPKRLRFPDVAPWNPSPGKHCSNCAAAHRCPIESDARRKHGIASPTDARRAVGELQVAEAVRTHHREGLRPYVEEHGPQPARWSKGRLVLGLRTQSNGKPVLTFFTPTEEIDRVPPRRKADDESLEQSMREAGNGRAT